MDFATALDVSSGGALLATQRYLQTKSEVRLEIPAAPPHLEIVGEERRLLQGQVVRVDSYAEAYLSGIRFKKPLD